MTFTKTSKLKMLINLLNFKDKSYIFSFGIINQTLLKIIKLKPYNPEPRASSWSRIANNK